MNAISMNFKNVMCGKFEKLCLLRYYSGCVRSRTEKSYLLRVGIQHCPVKTENLWTVAIVEM